MTILTTLPTAILQFAFTGVMAPHRRAPLDYAAPRVASSSERVFM